METITRTEAREIADELVESFRATFTDFGDSMARKSDDPDAAEIGERVQKQIDSLILRVEADLMQAIMDQPTVGATDGR